MKALGTGSSWRALVCGLGLAACIAGTGCQIQSGGQTIPSPYYTQQPIQYFPPGPEFKLSAEAAQMKLYNEQAAQAAAQQGPGRQ
jgi:hypothetical protein